MKKKDLLYILALIGCITLLLFLPTGFEREQPPFLSLLKVTVEKVDHSELHTHGVTQSGTQRVTVRILEGTHKGKTAIAENYLIGKLEIDKVYDPGDIALATVKHRNGRILAVTLHDHYRIHIECILFGAFFISIILIAGKTGARAVLTFVFTAIFLWKVLFPAFLRGWDPIWVSVAAMTILSAVIIFGVAGFERKGAVAFGGTIGGILVTCGLSLLFGSFFNLPGAVRPFSETLLHTGFPGMNIERLFLAGIFIASSGAVMDVGMDISASMNELFEKKVRLTFHDRFRSGMAVGKAVIGTMTTTLLLAYTGGYTAMFMVYMANGTPIVQMLNIQYIAAEMLHTLVGSFGLVTVAPLTALFGAVMFSPHTR
ncbi:MAG: YibE/F family protein [Deltaproteobacteria bacterium]|nr:YibE/F family protein [Deltaproteobacteria bacterium]MBN2670575.1 YibE/F family protein [Deltaproteobacteria bacterium]